MKTIINKNAIDLCLAYTDQDDRLADWLASNQVATTEPHLAPCAWRKGKMVLSCYVQINSGPPFQYWFSLADTNAVQGLDSMGRTLVYDKAIRSKRKFYDGRLYAILCSVNADMSTDTGSFEGFCDALGLDSDSRKAFATFEAVCKQQQILRDSGVPADCCEFFPT